MSEYTKKETKNVKQFKVNHFLCLSFCIYNKIAIKTEYFFLHVQASSKVAKASAVTRSNNEIMTTFLESHSKPHDHSSKTDHSFSSDVENAVSIVTYLLYNCRL